MAVLKVIANKDGYYDNTFFEKGETFNMDEADYKPLGPDGKPYKDKRGKDLVSTWVSLHSPKLAQELNAEEVNTGDSRPPGAGPIPGTLGEKSEAKTPKAPPIVSPPIPSAPGVPAAPTPAAPVVPGAPGAVVPAGPPLDVL